MRYFFMVFSHLIFKTLPRTVSFIANPSIVRYYDKQGALFAPARGDAVVRQDHQRLLWSLLGNPCIMVALVDRAITQNTVMEFDR